MPRSKPPLERWLLRVVVMSMLLVPFTVENCLLVDTGIEGGLKLKKETCWARLAMGFPKAANRYQPLSMAAAAIIVDAKAFIGEEFVEVIEKHLASRKFSHNCQLRKVLAQAPQDKVPGAGEIRPEILKAFNITGLFWLMCLYDLAQKSETVPVDWQMRSRFPSLKKLIEGCALITGLEHCSASMGKLIL